MDFPQGPLSLPNAVGVIIAHGNPGVALTRRADLWMTRDGGYNWYKVCYIHWNGYIIEFCPPTQKLELHTIEYYHVKVLLKRFHVIGRTVGFRPQNQEIEAHTK